MTFQFEFVGGPLDGSRLDGTDSTQHLQWFNFGAIAYRDTNGGAVGAMFDTFNPLMVPELSGPRPPVRLHTYQVLSREPDESYDLRIVATHVAPSERMLPDGPGQFSHWVSPQS